jgi:hypothetical protein
VYHISSVLQISAGGGAITPDERAITQNTCRIANSAPMPKY